MNEELETALAAIEDDTGATIKLAGALLRELKKAKAAASTGHIRELRKSIESVDSLAAELSQISSQLNSSFQFDEQAHLASGAYTKELLAAAADNGVTMFEEDERLLSYPSLIRIIPGDASIEIDKKRERRIRPSVVAGLLKARQLRGPNFKPEPFLASLEAAYDVATAQQSKNRGTVIRLVDIWSLLTLLPGQSREYTKQEFARDLYLLDQSKATSAAKSGRKLRWSASTGTKGSGVLTTVARNGQPQIYWGISFS